MIFDEIEKAHPDVLNLLLQVMEDGRLTDGQGRSVNFAHTVLIMTSNLGSQDVQKRLGSQVSVQGEAGREKAREIYSKALKGHLRPEFLNRVDSTVIFNSLGSEQLRAIVDLEVGKVIKETVKENGITVEITPQTRDRLAEVGFDGINGARPLRRLIQNTVELGLADALLSGEVRAGDKVKVAYDKRSDELLVKQRSVVLRRVKIPSDAHQVSNPPPDVDGEGGGRPPAGPSSQPSKDNVSSAADKLKSKVLDFLGG